ncbi:hypothetical protein AK89_06280 [Enterococcus mundtii CRL35]|nr:hypothetical protein AK89_06280 [Enterococcus mundtii CRL35]
MGGLGLPRELSSASRFIKVAFTKLNSVKATTEQESVSQFFHILKSVEQQKAYVMLGMVNLSIRSILLVAMWIKESITTRLTQIAKLMQ